MPTVSDVEFRQLKEAFERLQGQVRDMHRKGRPIFDGPGLGDNVRDLAPVPGRWLTYIDGAAYEDLHEGNGVIVSAFDAKGDILVGTGDNAYDNLPVGADDKVLMARAAANTMGVMWIDRSTTTELAAVSDTESAGTDDTVPRGDHVHAHEAAHIQHDTTWAAKGDLIVGTADNTAQVLTVGANDLVLTADSTQTTGVKWAAASGGTPDCHDEPLTDGNSNFIFAAGDIVVVVCVPN